MPYSPKVDINYPNEPHNRPGEVETRLRPRESLISAMRQKEDLALLMSDDVALDVNKMTPEQIEAQQEWVEASMREEAEDAFALDQADETDAQTMTPEDLVILKEQLGLRTRDDADQEYMN